MGWVYSAGGRQREHRGPEGGHTQRWSHMHALVYPPPLRLREHCDLLPTSIMWQSYGTSRPWWGCHIGRVTERYSRDWDVRGQRWWISVRTMLCCTRCHLAGWTKGLLLAWSTLPVDRGPVRGWGGNDCRCLREATVAPGWQPEVNRGLSAATLSTWVLPTTWVSLEGDSSPVRPAVRNTLSETPSRGARLSCDWSSDPQKHGKTSVSL